MNRTSCRAVRRLSSIAVVLLLVSGLASSSAAQQKRSLGASKSLEAHSLDDRSGLVGAESAAMASTTGSVSGDCIDGLSAGTYPCDQVDLLGFLPSSTFVPFPGGVTNPNDIWGWTDPQSGREYALMGMSDGTVFVDVTVPSAPIYLGKLMTQTIARSWRDVKVYSDHAFIVADGAGSHGMQVFDLTALRNVVAPPVVFLPTAVYDGFGSAHNIVINEDSGTAFAVGANSGGTTCGGGLHMIDVSVPAVPVFAGCFQDTATGRAGTGYTHDAQCITYDGPDTRYTDREICFGANETALSISDVTDRQNPVALSNASYPGVAYAHQGWLTEDRSYFYQNDELDERATIFACFDGCADGDTACRDACIESADTRTLIWDVKKLDDPVLAGFMDIGTISVDHNLYVKGNTLVESNYQSGVRFFDVSNPVSPVPKGFFDVYPADDIANFNGTWSNYPYFESGTIVATGRPDGLFLLRQSQPEVAECTFEKLPSWDGNWTITGGGSPTATAVLDVPNGFKSLEILGGSENIGLLDVTGAAPLSASGPLASSVHAGALFELIEYTGIADDAPTNVTAVFGPQEPAASRFMFWLTDQADCTLQVDPIVDFGVPTSVTLQHNYPNPFNPSTQISFSLPEAEVVRLAVYDLTGRSIKTLVAGELGAGTHQAMWDGTTEAGVMAASGVYLYRLEAGSVSQTRQMILMK